MSSCTPSVYTAIASRTYTLRTLPHNQTHPHGRKTERIIFVRHPPLPPLSFLRSHLARTASVGLQHPQTYHTLRSFWRPTPQRRAVLYHARVECHNLFLHPSRKKEPLLFTTLLAVFTKTLEGLPKPWQKIGLGEARDSLVI